VPQPPEPKYGSEQRKQRHQFVIFH
jgi:hypothetical protein